MFVSLYNKNISQILTYNVQASIGDVQSRNINFVSLLKWIGFFSSVLRKMSLAIREREGEGEKL